MVIVQRSSCVPSNCNVYHIWNEKDDRKLTCYNCKDSPVWFQGPAKRFRYQTIKITYWKLQNKQIRKIRSVITVITGNLILDYRAVPEYRIYKMGCYYLLGFTYVDTTP